jgi:asparagine synthase (glutamine-hydrolysing)
VFLTGIAGIERPRAKKEVKTMLTRLQHRGNDGMKIFEHKNATLGVVWSEPEKKLVQKMELNGYVCDVATKGHFARAETRQGALTLLRDRIGVVPLYYGKTTGGDLCFASEAKALLPFVVEITELNPASYFDGSKIENYSALAVKEPVDWGIEEIAIELRDAFIDEVRMSVEGEKSVGAWLTGGLGSQITASVASQLLDELHTFSIGFRDSADFKIAREVAEYIGSAHKETIIDRDDISEALPDVIYHLESFDPVLVRSSIMNFIVSKEAAKEVNYLLLGDGADELFGGYRHIKSMNHEKIANVVVELTGQLHNTTLQRIDRCTAAHGLTPLLGFLTPNVVKLALRIPARYKVYKGKGKWILREAMRGYLPDKILMRPRGKTSLGSEVGKTIGGLAENSISNKEFKKERNLRNGWKLDSKEELLYYRIFRMHFGELEDLSWMGGAKAA